MKGRFLSRGAFLALVASIGCITAAPAAGSLDETAGEPIDLVISLDTSGTMRELIESTRVKIWEIINDLAAAEPTPQLRVAILTYGNQAGSRADGWVHIETDLTADLDLVSERLFALESRGANEYVGRVLKTALERLEWSESDNALKLLFVAGNESADQDLEVGFREMSEAAKQQGILLSAIFCGRSDDEDAVSWREMATLAEGSFAAIDHKLPAAVVPTRFDRDLGALGALMNETFVAIGKQGKARKRSLVQQDKNALRLGAAVAATRAITKASSVYAPDWDLVNAVEAGRIDLALIDENELPRAMRAMTTDERQLFLKETQEIRDELRQRIAELSGERRRAIAQQQAAFGDQDQRLFDEVIRKTIREQARDRGFHFPEE